MNGEKKVQVPSLRARLPNYLPNLTKALGMQGYLAK